MTAIDTYLEGSLPLASIKLTQNSVREYEQSPGMDNTIRELAASIHEQGLLYLIIVRPGRSGFKIVTGTRRLCHQAPAYISLRKLESFQNKMPLRYN